MLQAFLSKDFTLCIFDSDNNAWDSQQYSQPTYSSQNSQMSSMELFSQQKGSIPLKFDQYQRSQSQATEVSSRHKRYFDTTNNI